MRCKAEYILYIVNQSAILFTQYFFFLLLIYFNETIALYCIINVLKPFLYLQNEREFH